MNLQMLISLPVRGEIWVNLEILDPQRPGSSVSQGARTNAKPSEKSKIGMSGRCFWCLDGRLWREGVGWHFATFKSGAGLLFGMPLKEKLRSFNASETEKYPVAGSSPGFVLLFWG